MQPKTPPDTETTVVDVRMIPRPRRHKREEATVSGDTGGKEARERAELALEDAVMRRKDVNSLRAFFARELARNHFAEAITATFRGER